MPRPRQIDRLAVLTAGLDLADQAGLRGVTMQAVASRLGVTPMALYGHVADKRDLLDGLVERLLGEIDPPPEGMPWEEQIAGLVAGLRAAAHRHPSVFPLLFQRPVATSGALRSRDHIYQILVRAGVAPEHVSRVERIITTTIVGFAASEASGRFSAHSAETLDEDYQALRTFLIAGLRAFHGE